MDVLKQGSSSWKVDLVLEISLCVYHSQGSGVVSVFLVSGVSVQGYVDKGSCHEGEFLHDVFSLHARPRKEFDDFPSSG